MKPRPPGPCGAGSGPTSVSGWIVLTVAEWASRPFRDPEAFPGGAGLEGAIVARRVGEAKGPVGFNALTEEYQDLVKAGVVDPAKVARTALENGASIASLLLTTEALVAEIPEEKPAPPAGPPGGDMYGGMGGM